MSDLADDPERRLTLRQAAQARHDFAMILDELDFVKVQLVRLPTRRNQAVTPLRIVAATAFSTAALVIIWCEIDLHVVGTDDKDVAEPDWVLQPIAIGPATARTADIGTGAMASAL
jgi:hypothetical protein